MYAFDIQEEITNEKSVDVLVVGESDNIIQTLLDLKSKNKVNKIETCLNGYSEVIKNYSPGSICIICTENYHFEIEMLAIKQGMHILVRNHRVTLKQHLMLESESISNRVVLCMENNHRYNPLLLSSLNNLKNLGSLRHLDSCSTILDLKYIDIISWLYKTIRPISVTSCKNSDGDMLLVVSWEDAITKDTSFSTHIISKSANDGFCYSGKNGYMSVNLPIDYDRYSYDSISKFIDSIVSLECGMTDMESINIEFPCIRNTYCKTSVYEAFILSMENDGSQMKIEY